MTNEPNPPDDQLNLPGCAASSIRKSLEHLARMPLRSANPQQPCDLGLFDHVMRRQQSLF